MLNAIFFATCYNTITNFPQYGKLWHMDLLIFYSPFSLISLSSSPSAIQYSLPPSSLSHTLSSSLFPFALFSSHSWIWATTDFLSTITDLFHRFFFFSLLFAFSSLFYLKVAYRRGSGCGFMISDCDRHGSGCGFMISDCDRRGRRSLGCGFVNSDCDRRGSLGCGSLFYLESPIRCSLFLESPIRCSISEGFIDSLFLWRFHQFILHLLHTGKFSVFSVILWDCHIVI